MDCCGTPDREKEDLPDSPMSILRQHHMTQSQKWPQRWSARRERGSDGSLPPYAGPLAGLWRGKRDEAGRGPLKHTPKVLFISMPNLTENAHSQAQRVEHAESQLDKTGQATEIW
ncbi:hypothetical protein JOQ06_015040, partial [Pogonophryne albipinna]